MYTLAEAVDSGDPRAVGAVVGIIGDREASEQLSELRTVDSHHLETIVMLAARRGDEKMFFAVLRSLRRILAAWKVLRMDKSGVSVAVMARKKWAEQSPFGLNNLVKRLVNCA